MKRRMLLLILAIVLGFSALAQASLIQIGFAFYDAGGPYIRAYGLIYDDDLELTWLDYTNDSAPWQSQMDWAASLNNDPGAVVPGILEYHFFPGYQLSMGAGDVWRLPEAGSSPGVGSDQTSSEMGHLYYTELRNVAGGPFNKTGPFIYLQSRVYFSGTSSDNPYPGAAWDFRTYSGYQGYSDKDDDFYALAVRSGVAAVPISGSIWLLGSGLAGLVGWGKKRRRLG